MCRMRFTRTPQSRKAVEHQLKTAQPQGHFRPVTSLLALLALGDGRSCLEVAVVLRGPETTVATWVGRFCCGGLAGALRHKPTGRPPQLTPTQTVVLATLLDEGPIKAGFRSACWRSPMIQQRMDDRLGVVSNVFYLAQLRKNLGFRSQQAAVVSDPLDAGQRHAWCPAGPQMLPLATARTALLLCGAEASCPQGGRSPTPGPAGATSRWSRRRARAKAPKSLA